MLNAFFAIALLTNVIKKFIVWKELISKRTCTSTFSGTVGFARGI